MCINRKRPKSSIRALSDLSPTERRVALSMTQQRAAAVAMEHVLRIDKNGRLSGGSGGGVGGGVGDESAAAQCRQ